MHTRGVLERRRRHGLDAAIADAEHMQVVVIRTEGVEPVEAVRPHPAPARRTRRAEVAAAAAAEDERPVAADVRRPAPRRPRRREVHPVDAELVRRPFGSEAEEDDGGEVQVAARLDEVRGRDAARVGGRENVVDAGDAHGDQRHLAVAGEVERAEAEVLVLAEVEPPADAGDVEQVPLLGGAVLHREAEVAHVVGVRRPPLAADAAEPHGRALQAEDDDAGAGVRGIVCRELALVERRQADLPPVTGVEEERRHLRRRRGAQDEDPALRRLEVGAGVHLGKADVVVCLPVRQAKGHRRRAGIATKQQQRVTGGSRRARSIRHGLFAQLSTTRRFRSRKLKSRVISTGKKLVKIRLSVSRYDRSP